jgi:hypothetical protein
MLRGHGVVRAIFLFDAGKDRVGRERRQALVLATERGHFDDRHGVGNDRNAADQRSDSLPRSKRAPSASAKPACSLPALTGSDKVTVKRR